jgi:hypothetical protein
MLVLDSGAVTRLAERSTRAAALIAALRAGGLWPPVVPSLVLAGRLTGAEPRSRHWCRQADSYGVCRMTDG